MLLSLKHYLTAKYVLWYLSNMWRNRGVLIDNIKYIKNIILGDFTHSNPEH